MQIAGAAEGKVLYLFTCYLKFNLGGLVTLAAASPDFHVHILYMRDPQNRSRTVFS